VGVLQWLALHPSWPVDTALGAAVVARHRDALTKDGANAFRDHSTNRPLDWLPAHALTARACPFEDGGVGIKESFGWLIRWCFVKFGIAPYCTPSRS
jgi:hypothetical protein